MIYKVCTVDVSTKCMKYSMSEPPKDTTCMYTAYGIIRDRLVVYRDIVLYVSLNGYPGHRYAARRMGILK